MITPTLLNDEESEMTKKGLNETKGSTFAAR